MRFDTTLFYRVGDPYPWETPFDEMHRTVELADELGFTGLRLAEHHFAWDGWYRSGSNPLLLGADRARYSDRPRFGQCGLIAPDWHPIRLAEDIATFDRMTRGRVDIGVAPGIDGRACGNFHPAGDRRDPDLNRALYNENVEILLKALTREAWSHEGRFHTFPAPGWAEANPMAHDPRFHDENGEVVKLRIEPGPHRKPRPPMWSMAESAASNEWHARMGIGAMRQHLSVGRIRQNWEAYAAAAGEAHGREFAIGEDVAIMRTIHLAETDEEAVGAGRRAADRMGQRQRLPHARGPGARRGARRRRHGARRLQLQHEARPHHRRFARNGGPQDRTPRATSSAAGTSPSSSTRPASASTGSRPAFASSRSARRPGSRTDDGSVFGRPSIRQPPL